MLAIELLNYAEFPDLLQSLLSQLKLNSFSGFLSLDLIRVYSREFAAEFFLICAICGEIQVFSTKVRVITPDVISITFNYYETLTAEKSNHCQNLRMIYPTIIQGGMGAGVSDWRLANAVSRQGQLGVVSGTALEQIMARRLQDGDPGGDVRRALNQLPFPAMAERIRQSYYIPGGKQERTSYKLLPMHSQDSPL